MLTELRAVLCTDGKPHKWNYHHDAMASTCSECGRRVSPVAFEIEVEAALARAIEALDAERRRLETAQTFEDGAAKLAEEYRRRLEALDRHDDAHAEAEWLINNFPADHLGSYTHGMRQRWVARRDNWQRALARLREEKP